MSEARIRGIHRIVAAAAVGGEDKLRELRDRPFDPIPIRYQLGQAWIWRERLSLWKRREAKDPTLPIADGWEDIAHALGVSRMTAISYARRQRPAPVHGVGTERVWAYVSALQDWLDAHDAPGWRRAKVTAMRTAKSRRMGT